MKLLTKSEVFGIFEDIELSYNRTINGKLLYSSRPSMLTGHLTLVVGFQEEKLIDVLNVKMVCENVTLDDISALCPNILIHVFKNEEEGFQLLYEYKSEDF